MNLDVETIDCENPKQLIVWLHGLGADGHDFMPVAHELNLPGTNFIFPHAPIRPITLNGGMQMRGWYDIASLERFEQEDEQGMLAMRDQLNVLLEQQIKAGFKSEEITLAGFSQGGVMALLAALSYPEKLKGVIALSCYLPMHQKLPEYASAANKDVPIFMAHGTLDPVVTYEFGEKSAEFLKAQGYAVDWHSYAMQHQVCPQEIDDLKQFLKSPVTKDLAG